MTGRPGARAGEGQPRPVRRAGPRADGRHELVSVMQSITLADELTLEPAPTGERDEVLCPGVLGRRPEPRRARRWRAFRAATGWDGAAAAARDRQADPGRGRARRRLGRRGRGAAPRGAALGPRATGSCCASSPRRSAPTSRPGRAGPLARERRRRAAAQLPPPDPAVRRARAAAGGRRCRRRRCTPRPTGSALARRGARGAPAELSAALEHGARAARARCELLHNDLEPAARSLEPVDRRGARAGARRRRPARAGERVGPDGARAVRRPRASRLRAAAQARGGRCSLAAASRGDRRDARAAARSLGRAAARRGDRRPRLRHNPGDRHEQVDDQLPRGRRRRHRRPGLFAGLILVPAWSSYTRLWERLGRECCRCTCSRCWWASGSSARCAAVYFWG